MKKKYLYLLLGGIFLVGLFLRFYRLGINLPPLYSDETGGHYWYWIQLSNPDLPFLERLLLTIQYTPITIVWIFGFSTFYARFMSALNGSVLILATYLFSVSVFPKENFRKNQTIALVVAGLTALLPWSYMMSRLYGTFPFMLILLCMHFFLFLKASKVSDFFISLIPLLYASYIYPSMFIIAPLAVLVVFFEIWKISNNKQKKIYSISFSLLLVIGSIILAHKYQIFNLSGRGLDLAIWRDVNTTYEADRLRGLSWNSQTSIFSFNLPPEQLADKFLFNHLTANLSVFTKNYLSFFSPEWLFLKGDPILRHSTGLNGEFYLFLLPFMLYGIHAFFSKAGFKSKLLFSFWILVSPIPAAITKDGGGYLLRTMTMMPFLTYLSGLGIVESFNLIKGRWKTVYGIILGFIILLSSFYFFFGYFHIYPALSERSFEYGFKELSDFQVKQGNKTLLIVWDGYYHNYDFRFWQQTPYEQFKSFNLNKIDVGQTTFWQTFPNLFFTNPKSVTDLNNFISRYRPDYVVLPDKYFVNFSDEILTILGNQLETIYNPDKTPALKIYELNQVNQKNKKF